jgi:hypothetical protein
MNKIFMFYLDEHKHKLYIIFHLCKIKRLIHKNYTWFYVLMVLSRKFYTSVDIDSYSKTLIIKLR